MHNDELLADVAGNAIGRAADVAPNDGFDARWAAWIERGRVHEQRVRRRFLICAPVVAIGAAAAFLLLHS